MVKQGCLRGCGKSVVLSPHYQKIFHVARQNDSQLSKCLRY